MKKKVSKTNSFLGAIVREIRMEKNMTGAELCRKAPKLDPRTLTALEKGRIINPSLETLDAVAAGLGLKVSDLFIRREQRLMTVFQSGTQKGFFQMDFPSIGIKAVSFTPLIPDFFCGKFIFGSRKSLGPSLLPPALAVFVSVLVGRFEILAGKSRVVLKEGENMFLKGGTGPVIQNLLERESVLSAVTLPSFLALRERKGMPILTGKR